MKCSAYGEYLISNRRLEIFAAVEKVLVPQELLGWLMSVESGLNVGSVIFVFVCIERRIGGTL